MAAKRYNAETKQWENVQEPFSASMPEVQAAQRHGYSDAQHNADGSINNMIDNVSGQRVGFVNNQSPRQLGTNAAAAPLVTSTGGPVSSAALALKKPTGAEAALGRAPGTARTPDVSTVPTTPSSRAPAGGDTSGGAPRLFLPGGQFDTGNPFAQKTSFDLPSTAPASTSFADRFVVPAAASGSNAATNSTAPATPPPPPAFPTLPLRAPQAETPARVAPTSETSTHADGKTYTTSTPGGAIIDASAQNSAARAWDQAHPSRVVAGKIGPAVADPTNTITATPGSQTYVNGKLLPEGVSATATGPGAGAVKFSNGYNPPLAPGQSVTSPSGATITAGAASSIPAGTSGIAVNGKTVAHDATGNLVASQPTKLSDGFTPGAAAATPVVAPSPAASVPTPSTPASVGPGVADLRQADEGRINAQNAASASLTAMQKDFADAASGRPPAPDVNTPSLYQPGADPARDTQVNKGLQDTQDAYGMIPDSLKTGAPAVAPRPASTSVASTGTSLNNPALPSSQLASGIPADPALKTAAPSLASQFSPPAAVPLDDDEKKRKLSLAASY